MSSDQYSFSSRTDYIEQQLSNLPTDLKKGIVDVNAKFPTHRIVYNDKIINPFRENSIHPPAAFLNMLSKELQKQAEKGVIGKKSKKHCPKGRTSGISISDSDAKDLIIQEWQGALTKSVIDSRLNRHSNPNGLESIRTKNGRIKLL